VPTYRVRIALDLASIRACFPRERPPVANGDWDAAAYVDERIRAYRDALHELSAGEPDLQLEASFDTLSVAGDRVVVSSAGPAAGEPPAGVIRQVEHALRPVSRDACAWRRHLRAAYFARHRAWRRETGSPIAH